MGNIRLLDPSTIQTCQRGSELQRIERRKNHQHNFLRNLGWRAVENNAVYYKSMFVFGPAIFVFLLILTPNGHTESASKMKVDEEKTRQEMVVLSRQLGVTCAECHNVQDFTNGDKKTFKVAKDHLRIVATLRSQGFDGKKGPEATCYMCHQGKLRPDYKEHLEK